MSDTRDITLTVNGTEHSLEVEPRRLLVHAIREDLDLTGTHIGCDTGNCGACTVLLDGEPIKSCLMFAAQADGAEVLTVEGMEELPESEGLHPLQEGFRAEHGLQCGYCTPGMIISGKALLDENPDPSEDEIREAISGNLCRCTGYQNIVRSIEYAADELEALATADGGTVAANADGGAAPAPGDTDAGSTRTDAAGTSTDEVSTPEPTDGFAGDADTFCGREDCCGGPDTDAEHRAEPSQFETEYLDDGADQ